MNLRSIETADFWTDYPNLQYIPNIVENFKIGFSRKQGLAVSSKSALLKQRKCCLCLRNFFSGTTFKIESVVPRYLKSIQSAKNQPTLERKKALYLLYQYLDILKRKVQNEKRRNEITAKQNEVSKILFTTVFNYQALNDEKYKWFDQFILATDGDIKKELEKQEIEQQKILSTPSQIETSTLSQEPQHTLSPQLKKSKSTNIIASKIEKAGKAAVEAFKKIGSGTKSEEKAGSTAVQQASSQSQHIENAFKKYAMSNTKKYITSLFDLVTYLDTQVQDCLRNTSSSAKPFAEMMRVSAQVDKLDDYSNKLLQNKDIVKECNSEIVNANEYVKSEYYLVIGDLIRRLCRFFPEEATDKISDDMSQKTGDALISLMFTWKKLQEKLKNEKSTTVLDNNSLRRMFDQTLIRMVQLVKKNNDQSEQMTVEKIKKVEQILFSQK